MSSCTFEKKLAKESKIKCGKKLHKIMHQESLFGVQIEHGLVRLNMCSGAHRQNQTERDKDSEYFHKYRMVFYLDFVDPKINIINVCIAPSTLHICIQSITFYMVLALHLVWCCCRCRCCCRRCRRRRRRCRSFYFLSDKNRRRLVKCSHLYWIEFVLKNEHGERMRKMAKKKESSAHKLK